MPRTLPPYILFLFGERVLMEAKDQPGHCFLLNVPYSCSCAKHHPSVDVNVEEEGSMNTRDFVT